MIPVMDQLNDLTHSSLLIPSSRAQMPESSISPFLQRLTDKCKPLGIKVGSYPKFGSGVDVSVIGFDVAKLEEIAKEVEKEVDGKVVASEQLGKK